MSTLVILRAILGMLALVAGWLALRRPSYLNTYVWSLVGCVAISHRLLGEMLDPSLERR
jgi:hypothetical protein